MQTFGTSESGNSLVGVSTGFTEIDEITRFSKSDLIIIAGRPSMGKTHLHLTLQKMLLEILIRLYFFSMEMSSEQVVRRFISTSLILIYKD